MNKKILASLLSIVLVTITVISITLFLESQDSDAETLEYRYIQTTAKEGEIANLSFISYSEASRVSGSGSLPPGLHLVNEWLYDDRYTSYITGTPTAPGLYSFTLKSVGNDQGTVYTIEVLEKVTYHHADGTTSTEHYAPCYPHYAPGGTATAGKTFCGWNTASDGSGTTYLQNSIVPPGIKHLYAQQTASPTNIEFTHSFSGSSAFTLSIIAGQNVMLPVDNDASNYSKASDIKAEIGWNTRLDGSGEFYPNNEPVQILSSLSLYGEKAKSDPSWTVVITGMAAYYVPRGEIFDYQYNGVPTSGKKMADDYKLSIISGTKEVVYYGYTMVASTDVIIIEKSNINAITVRYNANGGSGIMLSDAAGVNTFSRSYYTTKASDCSFIPPEGKMFKQWRMGSINGPIISPGSLISIKSNLELYAEWMDIPPDPIWVIAYDANGGVGSISTCTVVQGQPYEITDQLFTPPNQRSFIGWQEYGSSTIYQSGDTFTPTSDVILIALWKWDYFFVNLIPNGAEGDATSQKISADEAYIMPDSPFIWADHEFVGWKIDNNEPTYGVGSEYWPQEGSINLYAQWIDLSDPGRDDDGPDDNSSWIRYEHILIIILIAAVIVLFIWMVVRDD